MPTTSRGTNLAAFGTTEWLLLLAISLMWGSSFFFIEIAIRGFDPLAVSWIRVGLAAAVFAAVPRARTPIRSSDRARMVLVGLVWVTGPVIAFPLAQQWVDSSVAGLLNAVSPLVTTFIASVLLRRMPRPVQLLGFGVGLGGLFLLWLPSLRGASAEVLGLAVIVLGVVSYSLGANLAVPLQHRYGAMQLMLRAQLVAFVALTPLGLPAALDTGALRIDSLLALIPLGVLGSGLAFMAMSVLAARVGAPRASVALYIVPIVASILGVVVLGESLPPLAVTGGALVLVGAWLVSRRETT